MARGHGITLLQSYRRVARHAQREAARLHHGRKRREAEARVRKLRIWLGLVNRLLRQKRSDRGADKLYSLHAPEVECIGKGKARTRFEFGMKVSVATTNATTPGGQFVLGMQSLRGNS